MKQRNIKRKDFIRLSVLSGLGFYINSCQSNSRKQFPVAKSKTDTVPSDSLPPASEKVVAAPFQLYKKGTVQYEVLRKGFNKRINLYPAAIAFCKTTEEVAAAVAYANQNKLPVSIKSGGHSFEGFSSNNDGLEINLSAMNQVHLQEDNTAIIEPGCILSSLYDSVLSNNTFIPAGSCGTVGMGGLTLGGGYGLFSRKFGLTCDSLQSLTMVDGQGNIIHSKDDPELLWACKGGGNGNFGVVTSMQFGLQTAPSFLQSYRFKTSHVTAEKAAQILESWFTIVANLPLSCFSAFVLNGKSLYILLTNFEKEDDKVRTIISDLSKLVDKTTTGKPIQLIRAVKTFYGEQSPVYFKNASAGFYKNFDDIRNFIDDVLKKVTSTSGMIYQVNTLGGQINDPVLAAQSAYSHRDENFLSELQTYWQSELQTEKMVQAFEEVQKIFQQGGIRQQYRNYPDINLNNWQQAYYGTNYQRLQKVKMKYDPHNIFRYPQSIELPAS